MNDQENIMDQIIQESINFRKIAIVGASRNRNKFGNSAAKELKKRGYEIHYIHPSVKEIDHQVAYPSIESVKELAETVWVIISPESAIEVNQDASNTVIKYIWLQQGAGSPELIKMGNKLGLHLISGKCILMYTAPVDSFHKFHQFIWKFIGRY